MTSDSDETRDFRKVRPFRFGDWLAKPKELGLVGPQGQAKLESHSLDVLIVLAESANEVVSRDELYSAVWGGRFVEEQAITHAIWDLRRALGDKPAEPRYIETLPKVGYRLLCEVTWGDAGKEGRGLRRLVKPIRDASWPRFLLALLTLVTLALGALYLSSVRRTSPLPIDDEVARRYYLKAKEYEAQGYAPGKLESAEQLYRQALAAEPDNPLIEGSLALLLARIQQDYPLRGDSAEILALATRASERDPSLPKPWIARGILELLDGDAADARSYAAKALELAPDHPQALILLGKAELVLGDVEEGLASLRLAIRTSDEDVATREALALALIRLNRYEEAIRELELARDLAPDSPTALNNLAISLMFLDRYEAAVPHLRKLVVIHPTDDVVAANLGVALHQLGRFDAALEAFLRAHELAPEVPYHMESLGDVEMERGEIATARGWFERALAAYDRSLATGGPQSYLLSRRSLCAARLGRCDEAQANLRGARALDASDQDILYRAAQVHACCGDAEGTYRFVAQALAAGRASGWFRSDVCFRAFQNDQVFLELLEGAGSATIPTDRPKTSE